MFEVDQILATTTRPLVCLQIVEADDGDCHTIQIGDGSPLVTLLECDTGHIAEEFKP